MGMGEPSHSRKKLRKMRASVLLTIPLAQTALSAENKVVMLDMYRAMAASDIGTYPLENDNLASLGGVLKYLADVVREETQDQNRVTRTKGIDSVIRTRVKVKNPPFKEEADETAKYKPLYTDFGPYAVFDYGQSAEEPYDVIYSKEAGNWVGIQPAPDWGSTFEKREPSFWFSLGGFCPNLPWKQMPLVDENGAEIFRSARCQPGDDAESLCEPKGSVASPNEKCLKGADGKPVQSGLCEKGADMEHDTPEKDPTGEANCVYTYGKPVSVSLDSLVEIRKQACGGGRDCQDWKDFRENCDNPLLRRMFDPDGNIVTAASPKDGKSFCVEYSMHPKCVKSCADPECPYNDSREGVEYEIGLAYWKGRCDEKSNQLRAEKLASALGLETASKAHEVVHEDVLKGAKTCLKEGSQVCTPNLFDNKHSRGGPYCTRAYSGVCWLCFIPGVKNPDENAEEYGICPFDILTLPDYSQKDAPKPVCTSKKASDFCCLFTNTCDGSDDPEQASLDGDGLALMQKKCFEERSSEPMLTFMNRYVAWKAEVVAEEQGDQHAKDLTWMVETGSKEAIAVAYSFWRNSPLALDFAKFDRDTMGLAIQYTVTSTTKTTTTSTPGEKPDTPTGDDENKKATTTTTATKKPESEEAIKGTESSVEPWIVAVAIVGSVIAATACYFFVVYTRRQRATLAPPEHDTVELQGSVL